MSVTLLLPATFRKETDDQERLQIPGGSVGEVLQGLCERYPSLAGRLFREGGSLNRFVNVFVNDEDIRFLEDLGTPVQAWDEVLILPALAGG